MRTIRIIIILVLYITLTSLNTALVSEVRLEKKFKVRIADEYGAYFQFLKFKTLSTNNTFLVVANFEKYPKGFFKRNNLYEITYGVCGMWRKNEMEINIKSNKNLEKYPVHFMLDIKKQNKN